MRALTSIEMEQCAGGQGEIIAHVTVEASRYSDGVVVFAMRPDADTPARDYGYGSGGSEYDASNQGAYEPQPNGYEAVGAIECGDTTLYQRADGSLVRAVGGDVNIRNNNPGNIVYGDFAIRHGAIGQAHGFAVFPDMSFGTDAMYDLLRNGSFNQLTVNEAINRWSITDQAAYRAFVDANTSFDMNRIVNDLSVPEMIGLMEAMTDFEGGNPPTYTLAPGC